MNEQTSVPSQVKSLTQFLDELMYLKNKKSTPDTTTLDIIGTPLSVSHLSYVDNDLSDQDYSIEEISELENQSNDTSKHF